MTTVQEKLKMGVKKAATGHYPICSFCKGSLRKPCTIAWYNDDGTVDGKMACASCYRVWIQLQHFAEYGLITKLKK